jgi:uncharacterized small protein (DUF1192 family)
MHAFICLHGKPHFHGEKLREFVHRPQFGKGVYVWQNRALSLAEHNEVARKVAESCADLNLPCYTRLVEDEPAAGSRAPGPSVHLVSELEATIARQREEIARLRLSLTPPARPRAAA